jgi:hypothetical protein
MPRPNHGLTNHVGEADATKYRSWRWCYVIAAARLIRSANPPLHHGWPGAYHLDLDTFPRKRAIRAFRSMCGVRVNGHAHYVKRKVRRGRFGYRIANDDCRRRGYHATVTHGA